MFPKERKQNNGTENQNLRPKQNTTRRRAEYGFGKYGFKHQTHRVFLFALAEFWGESSVSSCRPVLYAKANSPNFSQNSPSLPKNSVFSLPKQYLETVFRPFPNNGFQRSSSFSMRRSFGSVNERHVCELQPPPPGFTKVGGLQTSVFHAYYSLFIFSSCALSFGQKCVHFKLHGA